MVWLALSPSISTAVGPWRLLYLAPLNRSPTAVRFLLGELARREPQIILPGRCNTLVVLVPSMQIVSYTIIACECYPTCVHAEDERTLPSHRHTTYLGYIRSENVASSTLGCRIRYGPLCSDREPPYFISIPPDLNFYSM